MKANYFLKVLFTITIVVISGCSSITITQPKNNGVIISEDRYNLILKQARIFYKLHRAPSHLSARYVFAC